MLFVGINPSTADETEPDPTVRRCVGFAESWGYGAIMMGNLYAIRDRDPRILQLDDLYARGVDNDRHLTAMAEACDLVVAAWGAGRCEPVRRREVIALLRRAKPVHALGLTKDGHPRHPLFMPSWTTPIPMPEP